MKRSIMICIAAFIAISMGADAQVNTGNTSLPTGSYGKKDTFAAKDLDRPVNNSGVTRETIRVERQADKNGQQGEGTAGTGSVTDLNTNSAVDTAATSNGGTAETDTTTTSWFDTATAGDNTSCSNMTSLYIAIALLTIALLVGIYILSDVLKGISANQIAGSSYALLIPVCTAIVAFYTMQCTGPIKALVSLIVAVALGLPMFFMRTMSKPSPKWLLITHSVFVAAGYALLIAYVVTR